MPWQVDSGYPGHPCLIATVLRCWEQPCTSICLRLQCSRLYTLSHPMHGRGPWQQAAVAALALEGPDMYAQLELEELKERSRAQMSPGGHLMLAWQATDMWRCSWLVLQPPKC